ncbi:TfoX/Sxy family protein [Pendulispora rubella]|uniref:TfoX/Sxy family protein n=1 Tax=Pendulispora rubella TaxID=2741070 RepID=A0ABZ2L162_9BACT
MLDKLKLFEDLTRAADSLSDLGHKKMFGCDALFVGGAIFAMVWKEGLIGVKLPDEEAFQKAMALSGARPWAPGGKAMSHWVLLPETVSGDSKRLKAWVARAHTLVSRGNAKPKKVTKPKKKAAAKKPRE